MNLSELKIDQDAYIISIDDSNTTNQLYEIGVLPGSKIRLITKSKLTNPVFKVNGMLIVIDETLLKLVNIRLSES